MKSRSIVLFSIFCLAVSLSAVVRFRANLAFRSAEGMSPTEEDLLATRPERSRYFAAAENASAIIAADPRAHVDLAQLLKRTALSEKTIEDQITKYCAALSTYGKAVRAEPIHSLYLINWANLRQILGAYECSEPYTAGDFRGAANLAIQSDPSNSRVMYAAALISLWSGDTAESRRLFHEVLSYDASLNEAQRDLILAQLTDEAAVQSILPARFPQIRTWTELFSTKYPRRFGELKQVFSTLQLRAIDASAAELEDGVIPGKLHYDRMSSMIDYAAGTAVRQRLDSELAVYLDRLGKSSAAALHRERSALKNVNILKATLAGDTRPQKGSFSSWGRNENVAFDEFYRSVGFFLGENQTVKIIEIRSRGESEALLPGAVKIFASDDNDRWQELSGASKVELVKISGRSMIWIQVSGESHPYWKIHFGSANRQRSISNTLDRMVQAYGFSELDS